MKKNKAVPVIYLFLLVTAISCLNATIKENKEELKTIKEENKQLNNKVKELEDKNKDLNLELDNYKDEIEGLKIKVKKLESPSRGSLSRSLGEFTVTCYDLSVQACGKPIGSKGYGITASGISLKGHTWETARAIAVDPKVIPLGSKVELIFTNEKYSQYNGIYHAVDTGGAIKGNKIDFFLGDFNQNKTHQSVWDFGRTRAVVKVLEQGR